MGQQILNLTDLCRGIVLRVDDDNIDPQLFGISLDAQLDLVEEVGLKVRYGEADFFDTTDAVGGCRTRKGREGRRGEKGPENGFHDLFLLGCVFRSTWADRAVQTREKGRAP